MVTSRKKRRNLVRGVALPCVIRCEQEGNDGWHYIHIDTPSDRRRFTEKASSNVGYRIADPEEEQ